MIAFEMIIITVAGTLIGGPILQFHSQFKLISQLGLSLIRINVSNSLIIRWSLGGCVYKLIVSGHGLYLNNRV